MTHKPIPIGFPSHEAAERFLEQLRREGLQRYANGRHLTGYEAECHPRGNNE